MALRTLFGYTDQPTGMQLAVYVGVLATMFVLMRVLAPHPPRQQPVAAE
jgi:high-affinity iron transporter